MQPSFGDAVGRTNWKRTLEQDVRFAKRPYAAVLTSGDRSLLDALHPSGRARFWGSTRTQDRNYQNITTGDVVLFTGRKRARGIGAVGAVLRNASFGDLLWEPHPTNGSWHNIYSLQAFEPADIPYEDIWALDGFTRNDNFMGLRRLDATRSDTILDFLNMSTADRDETSRLAALAKRTGDIVAAEQFTADSTSYQRPGGTTYVRRAESILVTAFRASLHADQQQTLRTETGIADFYAEEPGGSVIIEVKSSARHPYVRQALSQLLDYARFSPQPVARLAALFPSRPDQRSLDLLNDYGIDSIYLEADATFTTITAPAPARPPRRTG